MAPPSTGPDSPPVGGPVGGSCPQQGLCPAGGMAAVVGLRATIRHAIHDSSAGVEVKIKASMNAACFKALS